MRETIAAGHDVQVHCMHHTSHHKMEAFHGVADSDAALEALRTVGVAPQLWRPPYMHVNSWSAEVARARGLTLTGGVDAGDWLGDAPERMLERLEPDLGAGQAVVMHDAPGVDAPRGDTAANTLALLEPLVARARAAGLSPAALAEGPFDAARGLVSLTEDIEFEICPEDDLTEADRDAVGELLAAAFPDHSELYGRQGWRLIRPEFRVLARHGVTVVAVASALRLKADRPLAVWGMGDGAVHANHRGTGVGTRAVTVLALEILSREADVVLTDTAAFGRNTRTMGGRPVEPGEVWWESDGQRRTKPHWWIYEREPGLARPLRLEQGDF